MENKLSDKLIDIAKWFANQDVNIIDRINDIDEVILLYNRYNDSDFNISEILEKNSIKTFLKTA